jgi:hypothetical protein
LFFGLCVLVLAGGIAVFVSAQGRSNGPKSNHTTTAPKTAAPVPHSKKPAKAPAPAKAQPAKPAATTTASATQPKSSPAKGQKADKTAAAPTKPAKSDQPADTKAAKADTPAKSTNATTTTSSTSTKRTTGTSPATTTELTAVQQKLKQNTNLAAKVATRLPQGTDVIGAAAGFNNLGQFVAAANVSHNLQISFSELKAKMMTGMSLGQAIQAVRPLTASPTVEAQRAEYDARGMIYDSDQATSSTTATAPSTTSVSTAKAKAKTKNSAQ